MKKKLIYLASPYTHKDKSIMEARFVAVCKKAAELLKKGVCVYSPIAHTHPIAMNGLQDYQTNTRFWLDFDEVLMDRSDEIWVLQLDGWDKSVGVRYEMDYMLKNGKTCRLIKP